MTPNLDNVRGCGENATDEELGSGSIVARQPEMIERVAAYLSAQLTARVEECYAAGISPIRDERRAALKAAATLVGNIWMDIDEAEAIALGVPYVRDGKYIDPQK